MNLGKSPSFLCLSSPLKLLSAHKPGTARRWDTSREHVHDVGLGPIYKLTGWTKHWEQGRIGSRISTKSHPEFTTPKSRRRSPGARTYVSRKKTRNGGPSVHFRVLWKASFFRRHGVPRLLLITQYLGFLGVRWKTQLSLSMTIIITRQKNCRAFQKLE